MYLRELFGIIWYIESTCNKKLQYFWVSLYFKVVKPLWRHNHKFTRYTKTFLNPCTWQFLKIHSIPNPYQNHKEKFCEPDYFKKNEKNQNLPFSDLIVLFFRGTSSSLWCIPHFSKLLYSIYDSLWW